MTHLVDLADYLAILCEQIALVQHLDSRGIELRLDLRAFLIELDSAVTLGALVSELIGNAVEHAFAGGRAGVIQVRLDRGLAGGGGAVLTIADDGPGLPAQAPRPGSGLELVRSQVARLGAELVHEAGPGTVWRLHLPPGRADR